MSRNNVHTKIGWAIVVLIGIVVVALVLKQGSDGETAIRFDSDPVVSYGHGIFIWEEGVENPDISYVRAVQDYYLQKYEGDLGSKLDEGRRTKAAIDRYVDDEVVAKSLYLDWLISKSSRTFVGSNLYTLGAVRHYYLTVLGGNPRPDYDNPYNDYGISPETAEALQNIGMDTFVKPQVVGDDYIEACRKDGVPIPDVLFDDRDSKWHNVGWIDQVITSFAPSPEPNTGNELWLYTDHSIPSPGVCLALKRKAGGANLGKGHFDVICHGSLTNNACFFESKGPTQIEETNLDGPVNISTLDGGEATEVVPVCTRCHAGQNPFIVHPGDPAFELAAESKDGLPSNNNGWNAGWNYEAVHVPSWPPNPPRLDLAKIKSDRQCSECHTDTGFFRAGYFADIAQMADPTVYDFCSIVLRPTLEGSNLGGNQFDPTMPFLTPNAPGYEKHKEYLLAMCDPKDEGELVDNVFDDDPSILEPPNIVGPLLQCAKSVYVDDFVDGADIELHINGAVVQTLTSVVGADPVEFLEIDELQSGDTVQARQRADGNWSALTHPMTTDLFENVFGGPLFTPSIDPETVYRCASLVAVGYDVPGFDVEVRVNGGDPVTTRSFAGHKAVVPGKIPFELDDEFTAQIFACGESSPVSPGVRARRVAEDTLTEATVKPDSLYETHNYISVGELTYGSTSEALSSGGDSGGTFSTPLSWKKHRLGGPMVASEQIVVRQELCGFSSQPSFAQAPTVQSCENLPAPEIKDPLPAQDFVEVIDPIAGARVRVYDEDGNEIGDGVSGVITLTRPLVDGESVSVTQQAGQCISEQAFMIEV